MLKRSELYKNHFTNHFTIDQDLATKAVAAYASGKSSNEVAKQFNIANKTVLDYVRRAEKAVRPVKRYAALSSAQMADAAQSYQTDKVTLETLSRNFGVCIPTMRKRLKAMGVTIGVAESNRRRMRPPKERCCSQVYHVYKRTAKKRNIPFELTQDQVAEFIYAPCFYCGRSRVNPGSGGKGLTYNGLDRRDNAVGYVYDNVVPCCHACNRAKSDMPIADFFAWILLIANRITGDSNEPR